MTVIDDLKADCERLRGELKAAENAYFLAQQEASTVKIGDVFRRTAKRGYRPNQKTIEERARVIGFNQSYSGKMIPRLRMLKKDGSDGIRQRNMMNFEKWEPVRPAGAHRAEDCEDGG